MRALPRRFCPGHLISSIARASVADKPIPHTLSYDAASTMVLFSVCNNLFISLNVARCARLVTLDRQGDFANAKLTSFVALL